MLRRSGPLKRKAPLRRGKRLARTGGLKRGGSLPRKRAKPRRGRVIDLAHLAFVRTLPCCAPGGRCRSPSVQHHKTTGRGKGQKSDDDQTMPLCRRHHDDFHRLTGRFKGWSQPMLREWQAAQVASVLAAKAAAGKAA